MKLLTLTSAALCAAFAAASPALIKRDTCVDNGDCAMCYSCWDGICQADISCPIDNPPAKRDTCVDNGDCDMCSSCWDSVCLADISCPIDNPPAAI